MVEEKLATLTILALKKYCQFKEFVLADTVSKSKVVARLV